MRDCEFSEYMIERLYMEAVKITDKEYNEDEEQDEEQDEGYNWQNDPTLSLDEQIDKEL